MRKVERSDRKDPNFRDLKTNPLTQEELDKEMIDEDVRKRTSKLDSAGQVKDLLEACERQVFMATYQRDLVAKILETYKEKK